MNIQPAHFRIGRELLRIQIAFAHKTFSGSLGHGGLLEKEHEKRRRHKRLAFAVEIHGERWKFGNSQRTKNGTRHRRRGAVGEKQGTKTQPELPLITSKAGTLSVMPNLRKRALIPFPVTTLSDSSRMVSDILIAPITFIISQMRHKEPMGNTNEKGSGNGLIYTRKQGA